MGDIDVEGDANLMDLAGFNAYLFRIEFQIERAQATIYLWPAPFCLLSSVFCLLSSVLFFTSTFDIPCSIFNILFIPLAPQLRDLLRAQRPVVNTNIVNQAGEETRCIKHFAGTKV